MNEIRCIAIDDEPLSIELIKQYIGRIPRLKLVQAFDDAISGAEFLKQHPVDLLFIDINMPDITGIDLVRSLTHKPLTIFITAYKKFAFEGFELEAVDYLLKPVDFTRFQKAVARAIEFYDYRQQQTSDIQDSLFVRSEYKMVRIPLPDIRYIEGLKDYVRIHTRSARPVLTLMTMKGILEKLPADKFIRIHRSYIIPVDKIRTLVSKRIILDSSDELPIGESFADAVKELLNR